MMIYTSGPLLKASSLDDDFLYRYVAAKSQNPPYRAVVFSSHDKDQKHETKDEMNTKIDVDMTSEVMKQPPTEKLRLASCSS